MNAISNDSIRRAIDNQRYENKDRDKHTVAEINTVLSEFQEQIESRIIRQKERLPPWYELENQTTSNVVESEDNDDVLVITPVPDINVRNVHDEYNDYDNPTRNVVRVSHLLEVNKRQSNFVHPREKPFVAIDPEPEMETVAVLSSD